MSTIARSYSNTGSLTDESIDYDALISQHAPLVKRIAYHMIGRLPSSIQLDELVQAGMIGLFEALKAYDTSRGASFETYARIRIQGAMIDEVRLSDWTPRSVYKKYRQLSEAIKVIENREGRSAKGREIAEFLEMDMQQYNDLIKDAAGYQRLNYEDLAETEDGQDEASIGQSDGPYQALQEKHFKEGLAEKIAGLPERERLVLSLYHEKEFNMREIGEILGVTEGRVCQIHGQALIRLRARMSDWVDEND